MNVLATELIDDLTYRSYAHNRGRGVTPELWQKNMGGPVFEMEARYQTGLLRQAILTALGFSLMEPGIWYSGDRHLFVCEGSARPTHYDTVIEAGDDLPALVAKVVQRISDDQYSSGYEGGYFAGGVTPGCL